MADGIAIFVVSVADNAALLNLDAVIAIVVTLCQCSATTGRSIGEDEAVGDGDMAGTDGKSTT